MIHKKGHQSQESSLVYVICVMHQRNRGLETFYGNWPEWIGHLGLKILDLEAFGLLGEGSNDLINSPWWPIVDTVHFIVQNVPKGIIKGAGQNLLFLACARTSIKITWWVTIHRCVNCCKVMVMLLMRWSLTCVGFWCQTRAVLLPQWFWPSWTSLMGLVLAFRMATFRFSFGILTLRQIFTLRFLTTCLQIDNVVLHLNGVEQLSFRCFCIYSVFVWQLVSSVLCRRHSQNGTASPVQRPCGRLAAWRAECCCKVYVKCCSLSPPQGSATFTPPTVWEPFSFHCWGLSAAGVHFHGGRQILIWMRHQHHSPASAVLGLPGRPLLSAPHSKTIRGRWYPYFSRQRRMMAPWPGSDHVPVFLRVQQHLCNGI